MSIGLSTGRARHGSGADAHLEGDCADRTVGSTLYPDRRVREPDVPSARMRIEAKLKVQAREAADRAHRASDRAFEAAIRATDLLEEVRKALFRVRRSIVLRRYHPDESQGC